MIIQAWRVTNARYVNEALSGEGASKQGARWNSIGIPVTYVAESIALACLEVLVGGIPPKVLLSGYVKIPVEFDSSVVKTVGELPIGWDRYPHSDKTRQIGDRWAKSRESLVLKVPSAVIRGEIIYMINPLHPDAKDKIFIGSPGEISFDNRLLQILK